MKSKSDSNSNRFYTAEKAKFGVVKNGTGGIRTQVHSIIVASCNLQPILLAD